MRLALVLLFLLPLFANQNALSSSRIECIERQLAISFSPIPRIPPAHVVRIYFEPGVSSRRMALAQEKLRELGFQPLSRASEDKAYYGHADPRVFAQLSRIRGVNRVEREADGSAERWRQGRKSRVDIYDQDVDWSAEEAYLKNPNPVRGEVPTDLQTLRKTAEKGVTYVYENSRPKDPEAVRRLEELVGARVFFAGDLPFDGPAVKLPGVVMHIEPQARALKVRGDLNLTLGQGRTLGKLDKVSEAEWVQSVSTQAMPRTLSLEKTIASQKAKDLERFRIELKNQVAAYLRSDPSVTQQTLKKNVEKMIRDFFKITRAEFPKGAFLKWRYSYATREAGAIVTTFSSRPAELADNYVRSLERAKRSLRGFKVDEVDRTRDLSDDRFSLIHSLIVRPEDSIAQEKLSLRQSKTGNIVEFRVDVINGNAAGCRFRMGFDYFGRECAAAMKLVQSVVSRSKPPFRSFSGGMDVGMLQDGGFKIIETNPGSASRMMDPMYSPIEGNTELSFLLGKPTPLIASMERIYSEGVDARIRFLKKLPMDRDSVMKIADVPADSALMWFRDRALSEWSKNPEVESGKALISELKRTVRELGYSRQWEFRELISGAEDAVSRILRQKRR